MLHLAEEVSVRDIVEFIMRSGDLDPGAGSLAELDAMQEGQKLHRKIQKEGGAGYKAEVPLRHVSELDGLVLTVSGRADGVITEVRMAEDESHELSLRETVAIDEIKCTYRDLASMEDAVPVHRAQALCYAYFYACDHDLAEIDVQNTYVSFDKHNVRRFRETWTREKLAGWYQDLIEKYGKLKIYFHNAMNYDANFFLRYILSKPEYTNWHPGVIMESSNRLKRLVFKFPYIVREGFKTTEKKGEIEIADTFKFFTMSLENIVNSLRKKTFDENLKVFPR